MIVPNASSPDGVFIVRLSHDRSKETDPPDDSVPDVQIVASSNQKILATFQFPADPISDIQPLRTKIEAHWNPDGSIVALSFSERFYTYLLVYRLVGTLAQPESFVEVSLPNTGAIIQSMVPRFKEFKPRWHQHFQGWSGRNTIQFSAGTTAIIEADKDESPGFWAVYSFTVDISDPKTPMVRRVELVNEDDY